MGKRRPPLILSQVLISIPRIRNFTLNLSVHPRQIWPLVDNVIKEALVIFCTSQPAVNLKLTSIISFPMIIDAHCSHLKSLSLDSMNNIDWRSPLWTACGTRRLLSPPTCFPFVIGKISMASRNYGRLDSICCVGTQCHSADAILSDARY